MRSQHHPTNFFDVTLTGLGKSENSDVSFSISYAYIIIYIYICRYMYIYIYIDAGFITFFCELHLLHAQDLAPAPTEVGKIQRFPSNLPCRRSPTFVGLGWIGGLMGFTMFHLLISQRIWVVWVLNLAPITRFSPTWDLCRARPVWFQLAKVSSPFDLENLWVLAAKALQIPEAWGLGAGTRSDPGRVEKTRGRWGLWTRFHHCRADIPTYGGHNPLMCPCLPWR